MSLWEAGGVRSMTPCILISEQQTAEIAETQEEGGSTLRKLGSKLYFWMEFMITRGFNSQSKLN